MQQWQELEPALLPLIRAWLEPHGSHGWHEPAGVLRNAEPICAALNLLKLLLLRAKHSKCMPGDLLPPVSARPTFRVCALLRNVLLEIVRFRGWCAGSRVEPCREST